MLKYHVNHRLIQDNLVTLFMNSNNSLPQNSEERRQPSDLSHCTFHINLEKIAKTGKQVIIC